MIDLVSIVEKFRHEIYADLKKIVNANSFTTNTEGVETVADILLEIGVRHGIEFQKISSSNSQGKGASNLLYRSHHSDGYYAMIGHFDTVHTPDSDFNRLHEEGDKLIGPGVNDMKSGLLVALYSVVALKEIIPLHEIPLRILFNSDEETGSPGSRQIISEHLSAAKAGFVFEPGRYPGNTIVTERKGKMSLDVEIHGRPSHAGESPQTGINAVLAAAQLVQRLNELNQDYPGISMESTMISGGRAKNVIPDYCSIAVDIRIPDHQAIAWVEEQLTKTAAIVENSGAKLAYQLKVKRPPLVKNRLSQNLAQKYFSSCKKFHYESGESSSGGVSDANLLAEHGVPCLDGLGAVGQFPHTKKEYIFSSSLMERIIIFSDFFYNLVTQDTKGGTL